MSNLEEAVSLVYDALEAYTGDVEYFGDTELLTRLSVGDFVVSIEPL